jgi:hypothetical protein
MKLENYSTQQLKDLSSLIHDEIIKRQKKKIKELKQLIYYN